MIKKNSFFNGNYSNSSFQNAKVIKYYFFVFFGKLFYFILLLLSLIIMNLTISNKNFDTFIREKITFISRPIFILAESPFNLLFEFSNSVKNILLTNIINKNLKIQNIQLKKLYLESIDIKNENEILKKLLNFRDEIKTEYNYITSKVYSNPKTGLNSSLIINAGSNQGIKEGNLVIGINKSVVGRIVNVKNNYSDVLLLNDINSRIPARTASTKEKIILAGTNNGYLEISYFNSKNPNIVDGDFVYTSGDSNIIPDGFYIGKIKKIDDNFIVEMEENVSNLFDVMIINPKNFESNLQDF